MLRRQNCWSQVATQYKTLRFEPVSCMHKSALLSAGGGGGGRFLADSRAKCGCWNHNKQPLQDSPLTFKEKTKKKIKTQVEYSGKCAPFRQLSLVT